MEDAPPSGEGQRERGRRCKQGNPAYSTEFERFWTVYPNKRGGKDKAWDIWQRRQRKGSLPPIDHLMDCVQKLIYSDNWKEEGGKFIPMVTTFLTAGRWTDADALPPCKYLHPADPNCPYCKGFGLEPAEKDGVKGMKICRCRLKEAVNA